MQVRIQAERVETIANGSGFKLEPISAGNQTELIKDIFDERRT